MRQVGMEITLHEVNLQNFHDAGKCDGTFTVDSRLEFTADKSETRFSIVPLTPYQKKYPTDEFDYYNYIKSPDRTVILAYIEEIPAGEIRLRKNWNNYAYIEDIVVDTQFRRRGIGRMLIEKAIQWAKERNLPGIMLETQDNNAAGCLLYQSCGFELAGFDRHLYHGLDPHKDEVALYWYLIF
jgi:ribosomal protein S18 acetylase RimI-like enzyme